LGGNKGTKLRIRLTRNGIKVGRHFEIVERRASRVVNGDIEVGGILIDYQLPFYIADALIALALIREKNIQSYA
jgi:hypothetical protein